MPHGGPFARDSWGYDPWVQYLAASRLCRAPAQFRGSTGFGRAFVEKGDGEWGRGMQDDVDDGVDWLAARGIVDAARLHHGRFLWRLCRDVGGGANPALSLRDQLRRHLRCRRPARLTTTRPSSERDYRTGSAASRARRRRSTRCRRSRGRAMRVPILIAHGTADETVPPDQSVRLHDGAHPARPRA
jgi:pimeloyl-ACP methyl ester carboxylesterase